jgi:hypothetical protein
MSFVRNHVNEITEQAKGLPQGTIVQSQKGDWVWWVASVILIAFFGVVATHPEKANALMELFISILFGSKG